MSGIFTDCPLKAQSEAIVEKVNISSNTSLKVWKGNSHTSAILKSVYHITHLQNIRDFGL